MAKGPETKNDGRYTGAEAAITYRYLRFGMVAMVVLLVVSVLIERTQAPGCWQTSLSAYYYTPVHSVFVGALVAIGLCLVVIRGRDPWQDMFLNVAGMLAPIVALVPTSESDRCVSTEAARVATEGGTSGEISPLAIAAVQNNLTALFITGVLAVIAAYALRKKRAEVAAERVQRISASFLITAALVGVGFVLFAVTDWFEDLAHFSAAGGMFLCLGVVVFIRWRASRAKPHGPVYKFVWQGMAASVVIAVALYALSFDHTLLVLELAEIALFVAFWIARAHEDRQSVAAA